jgi:serine/threonine-protein kinase/endoribonuclease IRE1
VNFYRKYDFESIRDLIRMIRNKLNHFHEIPKEVKAHIGKTPEGFIEYCFSIFPKLLPFAYIYTRKKKWKLHMK